MSERQQDKWTAEIEDEAAYVVRYRINQRAYYLLDLAMKEIESLRAEREAFFAAIAEVEANYPAGIFQPGTAPGVPAEFARVLCANLRKAAQRILDEGGALC